MKKIFLKQSRSIGDRLPAVFQYFINEWKGLLAPFFIYITPLLIIVLGYTGAVTQSFVDSLQNMEIEDPSEVFGILTSMGFTGSSMGAIVLLSLLAAVLSYSIFGSYMALREDREDRPSAREVFSHALPRMLPVFIMLILSSIAIAFGSILFFIGAIIVLVFFAVAYPVIFMEDCGGIESLGRSFKLCKKNFFDTLLFFVVLIATVVFTSFLIGLILSPVSSMGAGIYESNKILGIIILGLVGLIGQIVNLLVYIGQFIHYGHIVEKTENNSLENEIMAL